MRFQSLEAFRGIAAVFVVFYHSFFTASSFSHFRLNAYLFVDFFFILSGFIISYAYLDRFKNNKVTPKVFLLKRIARLYPLHLFMLFIWLGYILVKHLAFTYHVGGKDPFETHTVVSFIEHLFLVQTWGTSHIMAWNVPSWSVSVEMMAYLLFIVTALFINRFSDLSKLFFLLLLVISLKLLLLNDTTTLHHFKFLINGLSTFFMGIMVYLIYRQKTDYTLSTLRATLIEVSLLATLFFVLNSPVQTVNYIQILFALTIFFFAIQEQGLVSRVLKHPLLQTLGLLSYSIYMIHALIVEITGHVFEYVLKFPTGSQDGHKILVTAYAPLINLSMLMVVIALAYATYHYLEQPLREKLNAKFSH